MPNAARAKRVGPDKTKSDLDPKAHSAQLVIVDRTDETRRRGDGNASGVEEALPRIVPESELPEQDAACGEDYRQSEQRAPRPQSVAGERSVHPQHRAFRRIAKPPPSKRLPPHLHLAVVEGRCAWRVLAFLACLP